MADSGAGSRLPTVVLSLAGVSTLVAVFVSMMSIMLQLRNYRKPALQRYFSRLVCHNIDPLRVCQIGCTNYDNGASVRDIVAYIFVFIGSCVCNWRNKGYIRGGSPTYYVFHSKNVSGSNIDLVFLLRWLVVWIFIFRPFIHPMSLLNVLIIVHSS